MPECIMPHSARPERLILGWRWTVFPSGQTSNMTTHIAPKIESIVVTPPIKCGQLLYPLLWRINNNILCERLCENYHNNALWAHLIQWWRSQALDATLSLRRPSRSPLVAHFGLPSISLRFLPPAVWLCHFLGLPVGRKQVSSGQQTRQMELLAHRDLPASGFMEWRA